eukprot:GAFH01001573.1.p1 GENE.GAFH01001573.1~~GAFH01001573.1.p1  ORF type:complete len:401 (-),score=58.80 GAFH01001573.1:317-1519(-)
MNTPSPAPYERRRDIRSTIACIKYHPDRADEQACPYWHDRRVCHFWLRGRCNRPDCHFDHHLPAGIRLPPTRRDTEEDAPAAAPPAPESLGPAPAQASSETRLTMTELDTIYRQFYPYDKSLGRAYPTLFMTTKAIIKELHGLVGSVLETPTPAVLTKALRLIVDIAEGLDGQLLVDAGLDTNIVDNVLHGSENKWQALSKFYDGFCVGQRSPSLNDIWPQLGELHTNAEATVPAFKKRIGSLIDILLTKFAPIQKTVRQMPHSYRYRLCYSPQFAEPAHQTQCTFVHSLNDVFQPLRQRPEGYTPRQTPSPARYTHSNSQPNPAMSPARSPMPVETQAPVTKRLAYDFTPQGDRGNLHNQMELKAGTVVTVIHPDNGGWTFVHDPTTNQDGFCPSAYLA